MRCHRFALAALAGMILAGYAGVAAQQLQTGPRHDSGQSVTAAFEGWFHNQDGSASLLFGYYNRNLKQELDIPIGAEQQDRTGGPRPGPADSLFPAQAVGHLHHNRAQGFRIKPAHVDSDSQWRNHRDSRQYEHAVGAFAVSRRERKYSALHCFCRCRAVRSRATRPKHVAGDGVAESSHPGALGGG